jgi:hypothetical protein
MVFSCRFLSIMTIVYWPGSKIKGVLSFLPVTSAKKIYKADQEGNALYRHDYVSLTHWFAVLFLYPFCRHQAIA